MTQPDLVRGGVYKQWSSDMPDAMSRDPLDEEKALADAMDAVHKSLWLSTSRRNLEANARAIIPALHAVGYRVVAAESETEDVDGGAAYARGPLRRVYPAAPTEEERQHE